MLLQVFIEQFRIRILGCRSSDNESAVVTVDLMMACVAVIELRASFSDLERVAECRREIYWALRNEWNAVHVRSFPLVESMPVNRSCSSSHHVGDVDHNEIILANVNGWTGKLSVDGHNAALDAISRHALRVETVHDVTIGRSAGLASTLNSSMTSIAMNTHRWLTHGPIV